MGQWQKRSSWTPKRTIEHSMAQTAKLMREHAFQCGFIVIKLHISHYSDVSFAVVTHPTFFQLLQHTMS